MRKIIKIEGLDCPNCAASLEKAINKIDVINFAEINFVKGTITFESNNVEVALSKIKQVTKEVEPEAIIGDGSKRA